jgi:hypothetical protein
MEGDSLRVRRTRVRREWQVYVAAVLFVGGLAAVAWIGTRLVLRVPDDSLAAVAAFVIGAGATVALAIALVLFAVPTWQLVLRPGSRDDVVVEVAAPGLLLSDAGYRIRLPWSCIDLLGIVERGEGWYRVRLQAADGFEATRDPLARFVGSQLRRSGMVLRFTDDDPRESALVEAVARHSGGHVHLADAT